MATKSIVDYFLSVCDANLMHVLLFWKRKGGKLTDPHILWSKKFLGWLQSRYARLTDVRLITIFR